MSGDGPGAGGVEPDFDAEEGLLPAVVQDVRSGRVRMLAYMNREALDRTRESGRVTFWSRSRGELWEKGETSGNWLEARSVEIDCDGDALLVRALPHGPSCHTGLESCFDTRTLWETEASGPEEAPGDGSGGDPLAAVLAELQSVVERRDRERPEDSHTVSLLEGGPRAAGRKVAEEALEVALAAAADGERVDEESADLIYHLLVLWRTLGVDADDVARVLRQRRASGAGGATGADERPEDARGAGTSGGDGDGD